MTGHETVQPFSGCVAVQPPRQRLAKQPPGADGERAAAAGQPGRRPAGAAGTHRRAESPVRALLEGVFERTDWHYSEYRSLLLAQRALADAQGDGEAVRAVDASLADIARRFDGA